MIRITEGGFITVCSELGMWIPGTLLQGKMTNVWNGMEGIVAI
jgi:hypothetical protein